MYEELPTHRVSVSPYRGQDAADVRGKGAWDKKTVHDLHNCNLLHAWAGLRWCALYSLLHPNLTHSAADQIHYLHFRWLAAGVLE